MPRGARSRDLMRKIVLATCKCDVWTTGTALTAGPNGRKYVSSGPELDKRPTTVDQFVELVDVPGVPSRRGKVGVMGVRRIGPKVTDGRTTESSSSHRCVISRRQV